MSYAIDVNLLLYATDPGCDEYDAASAFLKGCVEGSEVCCLAWVTVMSYLRMATHARIFREPLSPSEAVANIDALLGLAHVRVLGENDGFWAGYKEIVSEVRARANLVPDAHLATILRQYGVKVLYTRDRDFRKFAFLEVRDPLA